MGFKESILKRFKKKPAHKKQSSCAAVILAAGASSRMGLSNGESKQFLMIGDKPILAHTLMAFERCGSISEIVVVARPEDFAEVSSIAKEFSISKLTNIVAGGENACRFFASRSFGA